MLAPRDTLWSAHDAVIAAALDMLEVTNVDTLADYGCGDGRVLLAAAESRGCKCVGYEINADRATAVMETVKARGLEEQITIHAKNALEADFSEPTTVFLFLIKRGLRIMLPYLNAAAGTKPHGVRVVTALYKFPDHVMPAATRVVEVSADLKIPLYLYQLPCDITPPSASAPAAAAADEDDVKE